MVFHLKQSDLLTVNETATETPVEDKDSPNRSLNLAQEATFVNHMYSQQILQKALV